MDGADCTGVTTVITDFLNIREDGEAKTSVVVVLINVAVIVIIHIITIIGNPGYPSKCRHELHKAVSSTVLSPRASN